MTASLDKPLIIRPMTIADLEAVAGLDRLSFALPWPASAFLHELKENPGSILRVAEVVLENDAKLLVGMLVIWMILDEAHVATIAVHPDYRGRGIAGSLLADGLVEAVRRGAREATLEVRAGNLPAQALYRRFGFVEVGRRPRYYRDNGEDALIMTVSGIDERYLERIHGELYRAS